MSSVYVLRHAQSQGNVDPSLYQTMFNPEIPLSTWGKAEALQSAKLIHEDMAKSFTMDAVKPHKEAVCQFAEQLGTFLDTYDDRDASFVKLQAAVTAFINQIENPALRDAVTIMADMVLTEAFNYAWQHYKDFINRDQTTMSLIIADAVADGLRDACSMNLSIMGAKRTPEVFTVGLR